MDTTIFEVHYRPTPITAPQQTTFVYQSVPATPSQTGNPSTSSSVAAPAGDTSNGLISSLSSTLTVPPSLISQVNAAATSNPTLANMLQLAASGRASPDQLKTLGLLIQSLANTTSVATTVPPTTSQATASGTSTPSTPLPTTAPAPQYQYTAQVKEFDIVLEFRETPSDRWIFPRGPATCEWASTSGPGGSIGDITLTTIVPFPTATPTPTSQPDVSGSGPEVSAPTEPTPKQVVAFQFKMASSYIWDSFSRWVGSKEKMEENRQLLSEIEPPERKFLAYRLPEGSQLTQIQNAAAPSYSMKPIKPAMESGRPKRRAPRKSAQQQDAPGSPTAKRKRQAQPKVQAPLPKIACFACNQTDVPLIMGGRYCRPCAETGKFGEIPPVPGVNPLYKLNTGDSQPSPPSEHPEQTSQPDKDPASEPTPANREREGSAT